jgi:hypothetical protein
MITQPVGAVRRRGPAVRRLRSAGHRRAREAANHGMEPTLLLGWSLTVEMFFYLPVVRAPARPAAVRAVRGSTGLPPGSVCARCYRAGRARSTRIWRNEIISLYRARTCSRRRAIAAACRVSRSLRLSSHRGFSTELTTGLDGGEEPRSSPGRHSPGTRRRCQGSSPTSPGELALDGAEGPWHLVPSTFPSKSRVRRDSQRAWFPTSADMSVVSRLVVVIRFLECCSVGEVLRAPGKSLHLHEART